jgi:hypothetical protein
MESDRITTIDEWPMPQSIWDVQVPHRVANFSWRFIRQYVKVMLPLPELLKTTTETTYSPKAAGKAQGKCNELLPKWKWTGEVELACQKG